MKLMRQACINPECSNQSATPTIKFGKVISYTCEKCGKAFSVCDQGFVSKEELEQFENDKCIKVMRTGRYEPLNVRSYIARHNITFEVSNNLNLHSPGERDCYWIKDTLPDNVTEAKIATRNVS